MSKVDYIKCDVCGDILTERWGSMSVKAKVLDYGISNNFFRIRVVLEECSYL